MTKPKEIDWGQLEAIIDKGRGEAWALIPLLQDIQEAFGYIPEESIEPIAEALNLFASQVQGVISFYGGLSLKPKGKYVIIPSRRKHQFQVHGVLRSVHCC